MKTFLVILVFIIFTISFAQSAVLCKPLEDLISKINNKKRYNYSSVNKIYNLHRTSKCEGSTYDIGISKAVVQSLVFDFVRSMKVAGKNENAEDFVVKYVGDSTDKSNLEKILESANTICPREKKDACDKVAKAARKSLNI
jgi:hypothetical protein